MIIGGFLILALNLYCMADSIKHNKIKFACMSAFASGLTVGILIMFIK
jgi:hypothetical protein